MNPSICWHRMPRSAPGPGREGWIEVLPGPRGTPACRLWGMSRGSSKLLRPSRHVRKSSSGGAGGAGSCENWKTCWPACRGPEPKPDIPQGSPRSPTLGKPESSRSLSSSRSYALKADPRLPVDSCACAPNACAATPRDGWSAPGGEKPPRLNAFPAATKLLRPFGLSAVEEYASVSKSLLNVLMCVRDGSPVYTLLADGLLRWLLEPSEGPTPAVACRINLSISSARGAQSLSCKAADGSVWSLISGSSCPELVSSDLLVAPCLHFAKL
mmetsp:Transcript_12499/g.29703  ORF Transcript_12499/g.29703 Transcript_12499/m.29703 type:complete len:270 (+) Transcript_12499:387-1196(+)